MGRLDMLDDAGAQHVTGDCRQTKTKLLSLNFHYILACMYFYMAAVDTVEINKLFVPGSLRIFSSCCLVSW